MDLQTIRSVYEYDRWVNHRLMTTAESISPKQSRERFGASFDSIHNTFAHLMAAQVVWMSRWKGVPAERLPRPEDFDSIQAIRTVWSGVEEEYIQFINGLTDAQLREPLAYTNREGKLLTLPLWQWMLHVVNHGSHHRSEVADMLTRTGNAPEATDMHIFFLEKSNQL
jgi:uncharacterized damage-inducible protein DinB